MKNTTTSPKNYVIRVNGNFFDGMMERERFADAKRYDRSTASTLNRVIMCGRGKVCHVNQFATR